MERHVQWYLCALAALVMAYGWGYRGIVGHEGGAAVPGAMLGLAVCLGSGRGDWQRRAAAAGLFGAVGWAWGGSMSYMEHTMYSVSDSFPDVLYGYTMLFMLGGLWAGIGGAVLGLAFTLPRSRLNRFVGPFTAVCAAFLVTYLVFLFDHGLRDRFNRFTAEHMHDGDWFAALTVVAICGGYALARPRERAEALLLMACGCAWLVGYVGLTWFGGVVLAPPYRSESWSGVVGILAVLLGYLAWTKNRAALMLSMYGLVGGGLAFAFAVFVRHPVRVEWRWFAAWEGEMHWKIAEESFGLFMGLAIALGAARLMRGGLAAADEDAPRMPLDLFAGFVMMVGLMWMNLRRVPMRWIERHETISPEPMAGLLAWHWFLAIGMVLTAVVVYGLYLYRENRLSVVPSDAYGKGVVLLMFLTWTTIVAAVLQDLPVLTHGVSMVEISFIAFAAAVTVMVLRTRPVREVAGDAGVLPSDARWKLGWGHAAVWLCVPVVLVAVTGLSMAMQDGPVPGARLRFGENAYWREAERIRGVWDVVGMARDVGGPVAGVADTQVRTLEFKKNREVVVTSADGSTDSQSHAWMHADSLVWLGWYARIDEHADRAEAPVRLENERMYIPWPPGGGGGACLVLERRAGE